MNTNTMELNLNEMELVNGGFNYVAAIVLSIPAGLAGAVLGGIGGFCAGGPVGATVDAVAGGFAAAGLVARIVGNKED